MAESSDLERTEPASARRLEKAREEGQVARSVELSTFSVVLAGGAGIWLSGDAIAHALQRLIRNALSFGHDQIRQPERMLELLRDQTWEALFVLLPFGLAAMAAALVAPMLMSGWNLSTQAVAPDLTRLDPLGGLQRMFSLHSLVELAKSLLKAGLLGLVAIWGGWQLMERMLQLPALAPESAMTQTGRIVGLIFLALAGVMLLIAAVDVPFQLWSYYRKLRMTREEVRQEMKETEGDPQLKARIRSLQRQRARQRMMAQVPKADVVVTNPSRYAVALQYQQGSMRAPRVVAKGMNLVAARIRELAEAHRVPVLEAPPLARALYRHAELDGEIPGGLYAAVAEVLAYVYQLARWRALGGVLPAAPGAIPVPPGLDPGAAAA